MASLRAVCSRPATDMLQLRRCLRTLGDPGDSAATAPYRPLNNTPRHTRFEHAGNPLVTGNILRTTMISAFDLSLGLALCLSAAPIVTVFARDRGEHVQQHAVDRFRH